MIQTLDMLGDFTTPLLNGKPQRCIENLSEYSPGPIFRIINYLPEGHK